MPQNDEHTVWELTPFEAVGPLRMGMTNAEVAYALGESPTPRERTPGLPPLPVSQETFVGARVHVEYDSDGRMIAVEAFGPPVVYEGVTLTGRRALADVVADLRALGVDVTQDDPAEPDAPGIGVLLTVEPEGEVSGAMAVRRDYGEVTGQ